MSTLNSTTSSARRRIGLAVGSLAVVAIAGATAPQAFAAGGHHAGNNSGHHARKNGATAAYVSAATRSTSSLADAIAQVAPGGTVVQDAPNIIEDGSSDPGYLQYSMVWFAPRGGPVDGYLHATDKEGLTGSGNVGVIFAKPGAVRWLGDCGDRSYDGGTWSDCRSTTLPDGSVVRSRVDPTHGLVQVDRTVDGIVEIADAHENVGHGQPVLTRDQLIQVAGLLTPPAS